MLIFRIRWDDDKDDDVVDDDDDDDKDDGDDDVLGEKILVWNQLWFLSFSFLERRNTIFFVRKLFEGKFILILSCTV